MLYRIRIDKLLEWKSQTRRKPFLLNGARQVGKTHLIAENFGSSEFRRVHRLDFRLQPELKALFQQSLNPYLIIENIELFFDFEIDLKNDLIFFDEIEDCQQALDSLKYFAEELPDSFVCASGSNLSLLQSFPVGAVEIHNLYPLCFEEFLTAGQNSRLLSAYFDRRKEKFIVEKLLEELLDYYFVGGMPEAVASWFESDKSLRQRTKDVEQIHRNLISGYRYDFGKYSGKLHALQIDAVFSEVPKQLALNQISSVQRFRYKGVIQNKPRYAALEALIDWLEKSKLIHKCYPIAGKPVHPLQASMRLNIFKLFLLDVGLLCRMLNMSYQFIKSQAFPFKGYIAENFVQTEFVMHFSSPSFSWQQERSEIEFIHTTSSGQIVPVEVKSGTRTRARSLESYIKRYRPEKAIILAARTGSKKKPPVEIWPLYEAQFLADL